MTLKSPVAALDPISAICGVQLFAKSCAAHRCLPARIPVATRCCSGSIRSFIPADGSLVLVQDHPARLIAKACAEFDHAFAPSLARQHRLVDDDARLAPVLDVEHRLYVGGAVAGETLVGPA